MIRIAQTGDVKNIVKLIQFYMNDIVINESGRCHFSEEIISSLLDRKDVHYYVYEEAGSLCAVIAYKEPNHVLHFFVDHAFKGTGLGRCLWGFMEAELMKQNVENITVNSSVYAQPIYEKFGFNTVSKMVEEHGLRFIPMLKNMNKN